MSAAGAKRSPAARDGAVSVVLRKESRASRSYPRQEGSLFYYQQGPLTDASPPNTAFFFTKAQRAFHVTEVDGDAAQPGVQAPV